jgi:prevent-host-death family protein
MKTYTLTEARRKLASLLDEVEQKGEVRIKRRDGQVFVIQLYRRIDSPLNVKGLKLNLTRKDILESLQEGRRPN